MLTTSRRPTRRIRTFLHDLASVIPGTTRINRGKLSLEGLAEEAAGRGIEKVMVIDRWKGGPGRIRFFKVSGSELTEVNPRIYVRGIKLQREFGMKRRPKVRSLSLREPKEGEPKVRRLLTALSEFLEAPIVETDKPEGYDAEMRLTLDDLGYIRISFFLHPKMVEVGPQITVSHLVWSNEPWTASRETRRLTQPYG